MNQPPRPGIKLYIADLNAVRVTPPSKGLQKEGRIENLLYINTLRSLRKISVSSAFNGFWLFDRPNQREFLSEMKCNSGS
jgi:hypothetical protein